MQPSTENNIIEKFREVYEKLDPKNRVYSESSESYVPNMYIDEKKQEHISDSAKGWDTSELNSPFMRLYCAPETRDRNFQANKESLLKADTWSFGILMAEIILNLRGRQPKPILSGHSIEEIKIDVDENLQQIKDEYGDFGLKVSGTLYGLLQTEPKMRTDITQILEKLNNLSS